MNKRPSQRDGRKASGGGLGRNFVCNMLYQASIYIAPLVTVRHLGDVLGADGIGRYAFAQSLVSYFVLAATLGTTYYGQREIARAQGMPTERSRLFFEIALLRIVNAAAAFCAFMLAVTPRSVDPRLYAIAAMEILTVGLDISWFYQGMERFDVIALTSCGARACAVALIFLCVRTRTDLSRYALIYCGSALMGFGLQWLFLPGRVTLEGRPRLAHEKRHVRVALGLFVAQVAMQVYTVLDRTMIGVLTRSELQNGYYEQAQKLIRVLVLVSTSVGTVMASRVASLWARRERGEVRALIGMSFRVVCCVSLPIFAGLQLCADVFVPWFYGAGFGEVETLLRVLSAQPFVIGLSGVVGMQFFVPTGRERWLTLSVAAGSVVNFALNCIFILKWKALGAALASVVAEVCVTAIQLGLARRDLDLRELPGIVLHYAKYCVAMAAVGYVVKRMTLNTSFCAACVVGACVAVYAAQLILCGDPLLAFLTSGDVEKPAENRSAERELSHEDRCDHCDL